MMAWIKWSLIFLVFLSVSTLGQQVCPSGLDWIPYQGKCYKFVRDPVVNYVKAAQICSEDGATVVSINDADEHKFVRDWIQKKDSRRASWWTSGMTKKRNQIHWQGDGKLGTYNGAWKIPSKDYLVDNERLVYEFIDNQYGWAISNRETKLPFICEISLSEVYRISQEKRDFDYGLNVENPAAAPRGPHFLVEPESTVILGGTESMFFDCVATGNPEPKYEWIKTVKNVVETVKTNDRYSVTSGRLNIKRPNAYDEGLFQCKASNAYGIILSRPASVSFGSLGGFSPVRVGTVQGPKYQGNQLVCPTISGTPAISYQWYKNSAATFIRPDKQTHTFVSSTGKLFFSELTSADEGTYYCMATLTSLGMSRNYVGASQTESRTSVGFPLKVTDGGGNEYAPDIQNDFIFVYPRVPRRGSTIKLECFAYGTAPLEYTWKKRNNPSAFPEDRYKFRSANRILIIRNVELSDEDYYTCTVVSGKTKLKDDTSIDLTIQAEPFFIYPLTNQHVDVGKSLTWHCEASGSPYPTYKWYKNGQVLTSSEDGLTVSSNTLFIEKLDPKQNGMYQCAAINRHGTTFSSGQLRVLKVSPSFDKNPMVKLLNAAKGGRVIIRCNPIGAPRPVFKWFHDGAELGQLRPGIYSEEDHYHLLMSGDLVINNVVDGDRGRYKCFVENSAGTADDYTDLNIVEGATFTEKPQHDDVEVNNTAVLTCQASRTKGRDLIYEWTFNDHLINFDREPEFSMGVGNREGYLYVGPAQFYNEGWYTCSIISAMDRQSESAYLRVLGPPGEPAGVRARDEPFDSLESTVNKSLNLATTRWVIWMDGNDHGDPSSFFYIQFRTTFDESWRVHPDGNNIPLAKVKHERYADTKIAMLTDLKAGAGVQFRVLGRNAYGIGTPSLPTGSVQIEGTKPTRHVKNVRGGGGSVGDLTITWDPMPREDHNGPEFKYIVKSRPYEPGKRSDTAQWRESIIDHEKACITEFTFEYGHLDICHYVTTVGPENFYMDYEVQVAPRNIYGLGPPSNISIVKSAEEMPLSTAENIYAEVFNATALLVTWKPATTDRLSMRGKLKGYKINYWRKDYEKEAESLQKPIDLEEGQENLNQGLIIGLEPITWYAFNVQVYNHAGNGPKSSTYDQETLNRVPSLYPTEVHVYSVEGLGVRVNFRGVSTLQREEPLQGYKIQVWKDNENIRNAIEYDFKKVTNGVIRNLTTGVIYQLRVFGYSRAGQGKRSSPSVYFTVGGGEMRINLEVSEITSSASCLTSSFIVAALTYLIVIVRLKTALLS